MTHPDFDKLINQAKKMQLLASVEALLSWDQETYMPKEAIVLRTDQLSLIASLVHKMQTCKDWSDSLSQFINLDTGEFKTSNLSNEEKVCLKEWLKDYQKTIKLPSSFVEAMAKATSETTHVWIQARKENDFNKFAPYLENVINLTKEKANFLGYENHPYDALLDHYEPKMTTKKLDKIFASLKKDLVDLLSKIQKSPQIDNKFLITEYDHAEQIKFGHMILEFMTFKPTSSRLDESVHPFTMGLHPDDVRLTTRVVPTLIMSNISSVLHEGGHGLYEAGLPAKYFGTPLGQSVSLGVHESQSRFWETMIGKSMPFWTFFYPLLQKSFTNQFSHIPLPKFYSAINRVEPSLIRIESDEVTYCLHIILRYELEKGLIEGSFQVKDLPKLWNKKMEELLGIIPDSDSNGCMQDVHWPSGLIGYFPTYALGNIYAGQLFDTFKKSHSDWEKKVSKGALEFIRLWLKEHIHQYGRIFSPAELIEKTTNKPISSKDYITYLTEKYQKIYGL